MVYPYFLKGRGLYSEAGFETPNCVRGERRGIVRDGWFVGESAGFFELGKEWEGFDEEGYAMWRYKV